MEHNNWKELLHVEKENDFIIYDLIPVTILSRRGAKKFTKTKFN